MNYVLLRLSWTISFYDQAGSSLYKSTWIDSTISSAIFELKVPKHYNTDVSDLAFSQWKIQVEPVCDTMAKEIRAWKSEFKSSGWLVSRLYKFLGT